MSETNGLTDAERDRLRERLTNLLAEIDRMNAEVKLIVARLAEDEARRRRQPGTVHEFPKPARLDRGRRRQVSLLEKLLRVLVVAITVATVGATGVGFWLSYGGLHDFAVLGGLHSPEAWAWPASVDLFTLAGELGITISAITARKDGLSWALAITGFAPSVTFNLLHVVPGVARFAHYAVAAVPPVAAMLALAAMLRQAYRLAAALRPASDDTVPSVVPSDAESAALASLRATFAAGNPLSQNQLMERFSLTRAQARDLRTKVLPPLETAGLNGDGGAHG